MFDSKDLHKIEKEQEHQEKQIEEILDILQHRVHAFTPIIQGDIDMNALAAGQTVKFNTTPIPAGSSPDPTKIVWLSSDPVNAPVVVDPTDTTGLTVSVTFPSTVVAGLVFTLTINYTNSDSTTATRSDSFTTVAPPPTDVTGFTTITQVA